MQSAPNPGTTRSRAALGSARCLAAFGSARCRAARGSARCLAALGLALLGACTSGDPVTDIARATARSVVQPVVQDYFPGPQSAAITDCILNNATGPELFEIAREVTNEPGTRTVQTVLTIAQRPETVQCIIGSGALPIQF